MIIHISDRTSSFQIKTVITTEVEAIEKQILQRDKDWTPEFAFILVNKRCNARFFKQVDNKVCNPDPGTIVDTKATLPGR